MDVVSSSSAVAAFVEARRRGGVAPCVVVPTMGALHSGHGALIELGARLARDRGLGAGCVVTIFVNPTQFNESADFARYPRTLEADIDVCRRAGAAAVFAPAVEDVYPPGRALPVPALPPQATDAGLEDAFRPGHFAGVCQVVARLFDMVRPTAAVFGEKDWQQLQVVAAMVRRDRIPVEVVGMPTVREADGLAMSSRNVFLSGDERLRARTISRALAAAGAAPDPRSAEAAMNRTLNAAGITADYAVVRDANSLAPVGNAGSETVLCRALIAAPVGPVRLLDNAPWPSGVPTSGPMR